MIARLLVSFGAVAATVGFTLLGMATSYVEKDHGKADLSYYLMAAGGVATVIGAVWYRYDEQKAEAAIRARPNPPTRR